MVKADRHREGDLNSSDSSDQPDPSDLSNTPPTANRQSQTPSLVRLYSRGTTMDLSLIGTASVARRHAYAPYSGYEVGAAVRDDQGRIFTGCNVENVSYGLTLCAERVAIAKMVSEGGRKVEQIAIATRDGGTPCGMCLQTLLEFADDPAEVHVYVADEHGEAHEYTLHELLPHGFESGLGGRG